MYSKTIITLGIKAITTLAAPNVQDACSIYNTARDSITDGARFPASVTDSSASNTTLAARDAPICGKFTYYNTGLGSCGVTNNDAELVVALQDVHQGDMCGRIIEITHGVTGTVIVVPVRDTCPVCSLSSGEGNVVADLSPALFNAVGGGDGIFHGCWRFV